VRVVAGQDTLVRAVFADDAGTATDVDVNTAVTVSAVDGAGATVNLDGPVREGTGLYASRLPARARLDVLTVTFAGVVGGLQRRVQVGVDVVDERLVDPYRLREAMRGDAPELTAAAPPTALLLELASAAAEDWIDDALHYPGTRRSVRARFRHHGGKRLRPPGVVKPGELYEVEIGGKVYTAAELDDALPEAIGGWDRDGGWAFGVARVWGTHGLDAPPQDLRRAAVVLARYLSRTTRVPERAASMTTADTLIVFSKPDADKPTGLPEVDAVIGRLRLDVHV
jgi:hypothetical protein